MQIGVLKLGYKILNCVFCSFPAARLNTLFLEIHVSAHMIKTRVKFNFLKLISNLQGYNFKLCVHFCIMGLFLRSLIKFSYSFVSSCVYSGPACIKMKHLSFNVIPTPIQNYASICQVGWEEKISPQGCVWYRWMRNLLIV